MIPEGRLDALDTWLAPRVGATGAVTISDVGAPAGVGYSAETVCFRATYKTADGDQSERFVLRAETPDPPVYPVQVPGFDFEIELQHRVMRAVAAASRTVPIAPILDYEPNLSVLGTPFFVMRFVDGDVPQVDPPYTTSGFFAAAEPGQRRRMIEDGLRVLAEIHSLDWAAADLGWLCPPHQEPTLERQLDVWERFGRAELGARVHPLLDRGFALLRAEAPALSPPTLNWGDPRLGNMIWRDFHCVCVTDWEAASIAPPEIDLGWWLMFDRCSHEVTGTPRLEGEPTRDEQRAAYAAAAGRDVPDTRYVEIFAAVRYSAIVVRVMNRAEDRGLMPEGHSIWLNNPATVCLSQLLDG